MMSKPTSVIFAVLTLVAILAIAPSAFAQQSETTVNISAGAGSGPNCSQSSNCFDPSTVTVAPGTTIDWKNNDKVSHTVTSGNPSDNQTGTIFDSSLIAAGKDFSFTFNNPGTYNYFCQVHPWMTGQVIVSASAASSTPSGQGQQGGIPLGAPYTAPANVTTAAPTTPAPPSQAPQYGSQAPATSQSGVGQQGGIPLGSSYGSTPLPPTAPTPDESSIGWGAGMAVAAIMTGIGVWSAVRRR